jgi:hypothetical protein
MIKPGSMKVSEPGRNLRRGLTVNWQVDNGGNSPAIDLIVDVEVILTNASIEGRKVIPSQGKPEQLAFLSANAEPYSRHAVFGKTLVAAILEDYRNCRRENTNMRREQDKYASICQVEFSHPRVRVVTYYRNYLEVCFRSTYEAGIFATQIPECDYRCLEEQAEEVRPEVGVCSTTGLEMPEGCPLCPFTTALADESKAFRLGVILPAKAVVRRITAKQMEKEIAERDLLRTLGGHYL